jgi:hypothetical protein
MCSEVVLALATDAARAWSRTDAMAPPRVTELTAPRFAKTLRPAERPGSATTLRAPPKRHAARLAGSAAKSIPSRVEVMRYATHSRWLLTRCSRPGPG